MYGESVSRSFTIDHVKERLAHTYRLNISSNLWFALTHYYGHLMYNYPASNRIKMNKKNINKVYLLDLLIGLNSRDSLINRKDIYRTTQFKLVHLKINSLSETTYLVSITMFLPLILSDPFNDWNVMCSFDRKSILYLVYSYVFRISPQR